MKQDSDLESRLRRYAQGFRREATPRPDLPGSLITGLGSRKRREGPVAMFPAVAMAAMVLVAGLALAFGAFQLRNLGRATASPPILPTVSQTPVATATPSPTASATPTATPTPSASPSGAVPTYVPGLAAIQMVGSKLGWAVGAQGIYATTDGKHWTKQYSSGDSFTGVDFISSTTGWAVAAQSLVGTTDGGRSWHQLGEAQAWIRSVHFVNASQGWGIAGGSAPFSYRGVLTPYTGATLVVSTDGGQTWTAMSSPADPQSVCFSGTSRGWLATAAGTVYTSQNGGQSWSRSLQMAGVQQGLPTSSRIECAAPSAAWIDFAPGGGAAGHSPYVVYATVNGQSWRTVMAEPGTIGNQLPGVPAGPGSYPGAFSLVDAGDAVFVGDTPPANAATCMIATNGGATLKTTGSIPGPSETYDAAFISTSVGWVLTANTNNQIVIDSTTDGGYHWSQQLAVPR
jgi:photosystem II stability/assembly factor-like uncharacterized protein